MVCGGLAGLNCWFFSYGIDIAKTRIQANRPRFFRHVCYDGGLYHAMLEIYQKYVAYHHSGALRLLQGIQRSDRQSSWSKRHRILGLGDL